jgi:T5SS/PEP-CTERM-associated repeat protein
MTKFQFARVPRGFKSRTHAFRNLAAVVMAIASVGGSLDARAQTVATSGDVVPTLSPNPSPSWNLGGLPLWVGESGNGMLSIANGGSVSNGYGIVGYRAGSIGVANVDGVNSAWANHSSLYIGYLAESNGTLNITNGGSVSNLDGQVGSVAGSVGAVTVDGANSAWINSGNLIVGGSGIGTLSVTNGGSVSSTNAWVGSGADSVGTVTVDGADSAWVNSGNLLIGSSGIGTLSIAHGGSVSNAKAWVGSLAGSVGTVTIDGPDSTWINSYSVYVGISGTGTLTIANGGRVAAPFFTAIGAGTGGIGTLNIGAAPGETDPGRTRCL